MRLIAWNEQSTSFTASFMPLSLFYADPICCLWHWSSLFLNFVLQFPHFGLPSGASAVDQNRERMLLLLFLPKKICLNKLVWLLLTMPAYMPILVTQCKLLCTLDGTGVFCLLAVWPFLSWTSSLHTWIFNFTFGFTSLGWSWVILVQIIQAVALICSVWSGRSLGLECSNKNSVEASVLA